MTALTTNGYYGQIVCFAMSREQPSADISRKLFIAERRLKSIHYR